MKLTNITNAEELFHIIDTCIGKVELVSEEGDRLNLKSKLSQYFSMAKLFSSGNIDQVELVAYEPEDVDRLINYMLKGN